MDSKTQTQRRFLLRAGYYGVITLLIVGGVLLLRLLAPFVAGLGIAYVLRPQARKLSRRSGRSTAKCAVIVLVFFDLFAALLGGLVGTVLCRGVRQLLPYLPMVRAQCAALLDRIGARLHGTDTLREALRAAATRVADAAASAVGTVPGMLLRGSVVVVSSFFFASDFPNVANWLLRPFSAPVRRWIRAGAAVARLTLMRMVQAYGWMLLLTFAELAIGFWLLRIPNGLGPAAWIALIDLLPVLGVGVVLVPWAVIALLRGQWMRGIGLLGLFGIVELVRNAAEPHIVGRRTGLAPLPSLICMTVGLGLFGLPGLFAAPVAAVAVRHLIRTRPRPGKNP